MRSDCTGILAASDTALSRLCIGNEIFGFAPGCLSQIMRARTGTPLMLRRPPSVTALEACTLPSTWSTAYEVARRLRLASQRRFLLHAATGGVGLVLLHYAGWLTVPVYATAGQTHKHRIVRSLGVIESCSSRNGAAFTHGALHHLSGCRLCGACNSLIEDFVPASLVALREAEFLQERLKEGLNPGQAC